MMKKPKIIGIIPVRGGSKSVPRKNIKLLAGKPLLYYILKSALGSKYLTKVVVSSEDDEILSVAEKIVGKDILIKRPKSLAKDKTPDVPVIRHAVKKIEEETGDKFDYIVMLHATTPLVTADDIDATIEMLIKSKTADSSVSVYQVDDLHPVKIKKIVKGELVPYIKGMEEKSTVRRQDVQTAYKRNAGIYAAKRDVMMKRGTIWGKKVLPYIMPQERSIDINSVADFLIAETMIKCLRSRKHK